MSWYFSLVCRYLEDSTVLHKSYLHDIGITKVKYIKEKVFKKEIIIPLKKKIIL